MVTHFQRVDLICYILAVDLLVRLLVPNYLFNLARQY
jgi:hypothetical protein